MSLPPGAALSTPRAASECALRGLELTRAGAPGLGPVRAASRETHLAALEVTPLGSEPSPRVTRPAAPLPLPRQRDAATSKMPKDSGEFDQAKFDAMVSSQSWLLRGFTFYAKYHWDPM